MPRHTDNVSLVVLVGLHRYCMSSKLCGLQAKGMAAVAAAGAAADSQVLPSFWALSGRFPPSCLPSSLPYTLLLLCLIWQEEGRMLCLMPLIVGFALLQAVRAAASAAAAATSAEAAGVEGRSAVAAETAAALGH